MARVRALQAEPRVLRLRVQPVVPEAAVQRARVAQQVLVVQRVRVVQQVLVVQRARVVQQVLAQPPVQRRRELLPQAQWLVQYRRSVRLLRALASLVSLALRWLR